MQSLQRLATMQIPVQEARWEAVFCTSVSSLEVPLAQGSHGARQDSRGSEEMGQDLLSPGINLQLRDTALHIPPPQLMTFVCKAQTVLDVLPDLFPSITPSGGC